MLTVELPRASEVAPGAVLSVGGNADSVHVFADSGDRLN